MEGKQTSEQSKQKGIRGLGKRIVRESHSNEPPYADEKYMTYLCNLISSAYENSRGRLSRIDFSAKRIGGGGN